MKYKEIIDRINQKKEKDEDYYEELLSLEKEVKGSEPTVRPQLLYMMGVDHLVFEDTDKAFELQFSAFNHIIHTIYSDPKEIEVLSSTLQKVIIEMSKMISPTQPSKTIKMFYQKEKIRGSASLGEEKLRKMVREFREVRRLFPENNEIFNFLVQEDPKESLLFITNKTQTDLLVEKMKGSGYKGVDKKSVNKKSVTESVNDFMEVIIGMRRIKRTNKVLVLLFLYDEEKYGEYVKEVRKRVVLPPRTPSNFEILTDILTSCVSTGRVEALKGLLPDLLGIGSLLSKREKELVRMVYSDIYKVFTPENPPDEFVDLEQVVFFWFITGEYSKILRVGERVCKKVLFVAYSRSRGEGGERERKGGVGERGDHSKDEIYKEDCIHTTPYSTAPYSTPPIPSIPLTTPPIPLTPTIPYSSLEDANEMEKIGFSWKIENEFLKERVKFFLRMGDTKRVRETVEGVQGLPLLVEVLNVLREEKAFTLLRGIVLRLLEREKMVFTGKKVLLSFLHLKEIEIEVRERLRVIGGYVVEIVK